MQIGSLGDIAFEASSFNTLTPNSLSYSCGGRYEDHEVQGFYEQSEFLAPSLGSATLGMHLRRDLLSCSLVSTLGRILRMSREGEIVRLVIGKINLGRYTVRKVDYTWNYLSPNGQGPFSVDLTVELKEYYD